MSTSACHKCEQFWWLLGTSFEIEAISKPIKIYFKTFKFQVYKIHVASRGLSLTTCQSCYFQALCLSIPVDEFMDICLGANCSRWCLCHRWIVLAVWDTNTCGMMMSMLEEVCSTVWRCSLCFKRWWCLEIHRVSAPFHFIRSPASVINSEWSLWSTSGLMWCSVHLRVKVV